MTTSLEILEECFDRIYTTRKSVLASKQRSFSKLEDKRKHGKLTGTPARNSSSRQRGSSPARPSRGGGHLGEVLDKFQDDSGEENDVPTGKRTPAPNRTAAAPSSSSYRSLDRDGPKSTLTTTTAVPKVIENSMDLTPDDLKATVVFDEFRTELIAWLTEKLHAQTTPAAAAKGQKALQKEFIDACADCADYLTDKYLCLKLDPLHSSELVSKVRKTMSKIIEDFAVSGDVPEDFEEVRFYEMVGRAGDDMGAGGSYLAKLTQRAEAEAAAVAEAESRGKQKRGTSSLVSSIRVGGQGGQGMGSGTPLTGGGGLSYETATSGFGMGGGSSISFASTSKPLTKEEKEKARIKEQYAQFMNKKKTGGSGAESAGGKGKDASSDPSTSGVVSDLIGQNLDAMAAATPTHEPPTSTPAPAPTSASAAASASASATDEASAEDQAKAAQLEFLNNDIRSLLSSIQGKSLGDKLALTAPAAMSSTASRK